MKVNNLQHTEFVKAPQTAAKEAPKAQQTKIEDKLEISSEAKNKLTDMKQQKLSAIRSNIAAGKYDSDDVIAKVADSILEEVKEKN